MNLQRLLSLCLLCLSSALFAQSPTFEDVLSLRSNSSPRISPNGQHVAFQQRSVDWEENRYDTEIWLSKDGTTPFQLTNNPTKSSTTPRWSPDGNWIAFLSNHSGKTQIQVIRVAGGSSFQVTHTKSNISNFEWSPNGQQIAFTQSEDRSKKAKKRKDKYGAFAVEDKEYSLRQLWVVDFHADLLTHAPTPAQLEDSTYQAKSKARLLLDSVDFTVNDFKWSPNGKRIAFEHQPDPLINSFFDADISILNVATKEHQKLVSNKSYDGLVGWSPDGEFILYNSNLDNVSSNYYANNKLFKISSKGGEPKALATDFDENIFRVRWGKNRLFGIAWQKTKRYIVEIDPNTGKTTLVNLPLARTWDYSFSADGKRIAYSGVNDEDLTEVYLSNFPQIKGQKITTSSAQIKDWNYAKSEVISWKSKDGATIEGVLHKPKNFDPNKKYPLMVVIHGGPTGISIPSPAPGYVYPMLQWLNKGALILQPNYRGSAGYGAAFRALNVRNLGVGDAWDVLSGVQHLISEGMVDGAKVGAMGWSQGGYISAYLTTNSNQFKAISVGAGISNWMTYYVNTDIHPFTRQYLKATPWKDPKIYELTSPMTNITQAVTPTLIQHGEFDKRVPVANAYELFQGLQDVGVESKLVIYKGFGHSISKPKERLAAVWHNWQWFGKYLWDEEIELPME